jgi:hypothetical protein
LADKATSRRIRGLSGGFSGFGASNQDRGAIIFPERTWSCPEDAVLGSVSLGYRQN